MMARPKFERGGREMRNERGWRKGEIELVAKTEKEKVIDN